MQGGAVLIGAVDAVARETTLFASVWFLVGGIDDLLVDLLYALRRGPRRLQGTEAAVPAGPPHAETEPAIAIFVPAWQEANVIGAMLRRALERFDYARYCLYVGTYPNDAATAEAVLAVAAEDPRVRLVVGARSGPTTKADCLNALWRAMLRDEAVEDRTFDAVMLHDAEDVVHPLELKVVAAHLDRWDAVQLPVLPLRHPRSRLVSGHYCDEFAEAHAKQLLVRQSLGAALPLAGVGCAIRRGMLEGIAAARGGAPFDATSLTEDYELGLTIAAMGGSSTFARVAEGPSRRPVAVRAYFPCRLDAAVRQKARWLTGIALAGWDRTGWSRRGHLSDHWMRMRDRRATLAMPVLAVAYCALVAWAAAAAVHLAAGRPLPRPDPAMALLLIVNLTLLAWRLIVRALFVGRAYGLAEALWSVPRVAVGNLVALLAARRAAFLYVRMLAGAPPQWDKTEHEFPADAGAAA